MWHLLKKLDWLLLLLICLISFIGLSVLYSIEQPSGEFIRFKKQLVKFLVFFPLMIAIAITDTRLLYRFAYAGFFFALLLLLYVEIRGETAMGAKRWINLLGITLQPSELMKIALALAIAKFMHDVGVKFISKIYVLLIPISFIIIVTILILRQPNLGTSVIIASMGVVILFYSGVYIRLFFLAFVLFAFTIPLAWNYLLHDYQKKRVETFLNPSADPLGAGYNIIQSKIAVGSGGILGKGYMQGSQSQLDFIPEKETDFIFSVISEEFGFIGGFTTITLYLLMLFKGMFNLANARNSFIRLAGVGILFVIFANMFINIGMAIGILPVVGVPLPLISYGGSNLIASLIGFGIVLNASVFQEIEIKNNNFLREP